MLHPFLERESFADKMRAKVPRNSVFQLSLLPAGINSCCCCFHLGTWQLKKDKKDDLKGLWIIAIYIRNSRSCLLLLVNVWV